jgi:hypothetical protein
MKNIFENWNKFLNEFWYSDVQLEDGGAEYALAVIPKKKIKIKLCEQGTMMYGGEISEGEGPEDKFFQKAISIGNQIKQIHNQFIDQITQKGTKKLSVDDVHNMIVFFTDDVEIKTGVKLIGCGKFRCVFDVDNDYVIKIDVTPRGSARNQNETDAKLGRVGYGNLFAKSYIADKDHSWVVLEKVTPFQKTDTAKFISYFPNKKVNFTDKFLHYKLVIYCFLYHAGYRQYAIKEFNNFKAKFPDAVKDLPELPVIADGFVNSNPYDKVIRVITELGIRPDEIRLNNTGQGVDKRFVIIDSSLEDQIISGFEEQDDAPLPTPPKPKVVGGEETFKLK